MPHNEWWFLKWNAIALDDVFKRCKILLGRSTTLQKRFWRCCRNTSVFFVRWMPGFLEIFRALVWGYCNFNSCYHESWYIDNVSSQNHPQLGSNWDSSENRTSNSPDPLQSSLLGTLCISVQRHGTIKSGSWRPHSLTECNLFRLASVDWLSRRRFCWMLSNCHRYNDPVQGLKEFCFFLPYVKHVGQSFFFCLFSSFARFDSYQTFTSDGSNQFQDRVVMALMNDSWILEAV